MEQQRTAADQSPAAIVLGCMDSRAPAEIVFDLGLGAIFNCRVAGSVESADVLGSLEYATKIAGAKLIVVKGHSSCGAVQGAIADKNLGHLTQLLAKIRPAIAETEYLGTRTADNPEFVDAVARKSVELTVGRIRGSSPVIAELERSGAIKIVACFYNLSTGVVEFLSERRTPAAERTPPPSFGGFELRVVLRLRPPARRAGKTALQGARPGGLRLGPGHPTFGRPLARRFSDSRPRLARSRANPKHYTQLEHVYSGLPLK